ncbi:hypothetical protein DS843_30350 [Roseomonas genomospecies 6]|uniref:IstB-like ATP-binding domain-containing protein n=1 Tax=Roseomonas genomospecies 6 TaxID=214106 RepID=A0A9W7KMQ8_9PROT|nr:hypothetical protein DS843_30350 [Roseomonas genomospecies 6]
MELEARRQRLIRCDHAPLTYQLGAAKLPLAKTLAEFDFTASPLNEGLVRDLHDGSFLETQRNAVFIGGPVPAS